MGFLDEYTDDDFSKNLAVFLTLVLTAWLLLLWNNDKNLNPPAGTALGGAALVLAILSFVSMVIIGFDLNEKVPFFETLLYGDKKRLIVSAIAGIILIAFLSGGKQSILPLGVASVVSSNNVFTGFLSPIIEGTFFRGVLDPSFRKIFKAFKLPFPNLLGIIGAATLFAYAHTGVYNLGGSAIWAAFAFAIVMSFGVALFKSLGFEMGSHIANNIAYLISIHAFG